MGEEMSYFKITMFRGDTHKVTASLSMDGKEVDLTGYTVKIISRVDNTEIISASVDGTTATFNFTKSVSSSLPAKTIPVMLVFESSVQRASQLGSLCISEGVDPNVY